MDLLLDPVEFGRSFGLNFSVQHVPEGRIEIALDPPGGSRSNEQVEADNVRRATLRNLLQRIRPVPERDGGKNTTVCINHKNVAIHSTVLCQQGLLEPIDLGYLDQIFGNDACPLCRLLQRYLHQVFLQQLQLPGTPIQCRFLSAKSSYSEENDFASGPSNDYLWLVLQLVRAGPDFKPLHDYNILDTGFHLITDGKYSCRPVTEHIDLGLVRSWLRMCRTRHGQSCQHQNTSISSNPLERPRLVDVNSRYVITSPKPSEYLALSYVWGPDHKQPFRSQTNNSMDAQGRLVDLCLPQSLPRTIEDAIYLTQQLGYQFLWIDVLCIIQDHKDHKEAQITRMGHIYSAAVMTIAAAGGKDVQASLPGVKPHSRFRHQISETIGKETLANILPRSKSAIKNSTWNDRAWTFQERILSRRCLIVTQFQTYFQCNQESWCEDTKAELTHISSSERIRNRHALSHSLLTSKVNADEVFETYAFLVNSFTKRELSFPKDVLLAFHGTIEIFERAQSLSFLYGLPKEILACALLWQPVQPLLRRTNSGGLVCQPWDGHQNQNAFLPSWAWAAWSGEVKYLKHDYMQKNIKCDFVLQDPHHTCKSDDSLTGYLDPDQLLNFWTECTEFIISRPTTVNPYDSGPDAWKVESFQAVQGLENEKLGSLRNVVVLDRDGQEAGEVLLDTALGFPSGKQKFILIYETRTTTRSIWRRGWGGIIDEHFIDNGGRGNLEFVPAAPEEPWSYLKVMMVHQSSGLTYRVGVGTIHKEAWKFHCPVRKFIQLA